MEHHPNADDADQATAPSARHAEAYLRHLADTELRRTMERPQHEPRRPTTERPRLAPAAHAVNRVRTAAGALIASGAIDEATAISVLGGLVEALMERSRLPPSNPYRSLVMPVLWRAMPTPGADGPELQATAVPPELPEAWKSVLADRDRHDGRDGLAPFAAVLPELDGARFAITGLWSTSQSATLRALAWGWRSRRAPFPRTGKRFSWWVRDNTGRWHVGRQTNMGPGDADGHTALNVALTPPLHPAATSFEIILTGQSARVAATTPLDWQALW